MIKVSMLVTSDVIRLPQLHSEFDHNQYLYNIQNTEHSIRSTLQVQHAIHLDMKICSFPAQP
jgi:hypothetical protein